MVDWNIPQTRALAALDAYTFKFPMKILDQDRDALKTMVRYSIDHGTSTRDLAQAIINHFKDGIKYINDKGNAELFHPSESWAKIFAQTETARAYNAGTLDLYRAGEFKRVMLSTCLDERVCNACSKLDGKIYAINKAPELPKHQACRCTWLLPEED